MKNYHENQEKKQEKSKYVPGSQYEKECSQCDRILYGPRDMKQHDDNSTTRTLFSGLAAAGNDL